MVKKFKFLILVLFFLPKYSSSCELDQKFNYFFDSSMARQLVESLGLFTYNLGGHILNGKSLPNVYFLSANAPSPDVSKKHIIHRVRRGADIFNNTWSTLLVIEPYLENCSEPFYRLMSNIHNTRQAFKKFGDIKSHVEFTKGEFIDEQNLKEFQDKFKVILAKYGLETIHDKDSLKMSIKLNRIVRSDGSRLQYLNYVDSTSRTINYNYYTTDINDDDYHSFESLTYLIGAINSEIPIRFKHGNQLGWGKSIFKFLDPYSEYDIAKFIRSLTILFILTYAAIYFRKIKDAWRSKA